MLSPGLLWTNAAVRWADYRAWMEPDAFESQVLEPLELRFNGNKVLVHVRSTIRGAGSGIEADFLASAGVCVTHTRCGATSR